MGRRITVRALVAAGALLAILAILAVWVSRQALETDQWARTSSALLEDDAIQTGVSNFLVDQLYTHVDVAGELQAAFPERAAPLAEPAAGALRRAAVEVTGQALDRPLVQRTWEQANRRAHEQLVLVIEGGGPVLGTGEGVVTLDLGVLVSQTAERTGIGGAVADRLPPDAAKVEILRSDQLETVQTIGRMLKPLAAVFVLLALGCFATAVWLAPGRRREAVRAAGLALVFAGACALVLRSILGGIIVDELATTAAAEPVVSSVWTIGTSLLVGVAAATIVYGALAVIGAWLAGPTTWAIGIRRALAPYLASAAVTYGAVAAIVLLVLLWGPTEGTRRILPAIVLLVLLVAGVEALRRQTAREFPDARRGEARASLAAAVARARSASGARRRDGDGTGVAPSAAPPIAAVDDDLIAQLERLSALHRDGGLDDAEFAAAKHRVLEHV